MFTIYFKRIINNKIQNCSTIIKAKNIAEATLYALEHYSDGSFPVRVQEN